MQIILMDVDGTMTEWNRGNPMPGDAPLVHLETLVMSRHQVDRTDARRMILACGDISLHCLSEFLPELDVETGEYFDLLVEELSQYLVIPPDTVIFLRAMKEQGIPVYTATTHSPFIPRAKLAVGGISDRFGCPYLAGYHPGNEFGDPGGKFSPFFFPNILHHHGYDPASTMMIGDEVERDLYPALQAGIPCGMIVDRTRVEKIVFEDQGIYVNTLEAAVQLTTKEKS